MGRNVAAGLALLMAGCVATPQYKDPLASLTPLTKKEGLFARQNLRVVVSENTQKALKYLAEMHSRTSERGYLEPRELTDRISQMLAARFKEILFVTDPSQREENQTGLIMILDLRLVLAWSSLQKTTVELSGIFTDADRREMATVSGKGIAGGRPGVGAIRAAYIEATSAALAEFAQNLDNDQKLIELVSARAPVVTASARPATRPTIEPGELASKVRRLGGTAWALVVGINAYRQAERLNYAVNDAEAVAAALPGLGFHNVRVLLDEEATKAGIERAIYRDLRQRMGPEDRFFVFFAGHGITVRLPRGGEEGYLIPVDGDPTQPELTAIPMDEIRKMGKRVPAKHIFFAIDSCFSGFAATRDIRPESVTDPEIAMALEEPVVQVLTAGRKGQKAVEEEGHGLFTRRLLDGLRGLADREGRGFVTVTQLAGWLGPRVVRDSAGRQHPQYSALDGEGDFVFILPQR